MSAETERVLQEHLQKKSERRGRQCPRVQCADGFHMSVQTSDGHYCRPRQNTGPWSLVEVGYPSGPVPELAKYKDGEYPDTEAVFGYVPVSTVAAIIDRHGGFAP